MALRLALYGGGAATLMAWFLWPKHKSSITIPPYKMEHWKDTVPLSTYIMARIVHLVHWDILKYFLLEASDSSGLLDRKDIDGKSAYHFTELVPGQVWSVLYTYQMEKMLAGMILAGANLDEEAFLSEAPAEKRDILKKDLARCRECQKLPMPESSASGRYFKEGLSLDTRMYVVKLTTGGLLLYSPVKIDDEVKSFFSTLPGGGVVKIIVSPSAAHHFWVKSAQDAYPGARVVAGDSSGVKLAKGGVRVDVNYSTPAGADELRKLLRGSMSIRVCDGDPNQELVMFHLPSRTALCCDLLYTKADLDRGKKRSDGGGRTEHDIAMATDPARWAGRIFRAYWVDRSPNGLLPIYRYRLLDVDHFRPGGQGADEWTAERFAADLRAVIKEGTDVRAMRLVSCHLDEPLPWEQAERVIRASWDFLRI